MILPENIASTKPRQFHRGPAIIGAFEVQFDTDFTFDDDIYAGKRTVLANNNFSCIVKVL